MTRGFAVVLTLLLLGFALFTAWWSTRRTDYFPTALQSVFIDCVSPGGRDRQPVLYDFSADWYSGVLSDFEEPSLYRRPADAPRSVRFTWIRSFHDPIVVRIDTLTDGSSRLTAKQNPAGAGFGPEARIPGPPRRMMRLLNPVEEEALDRALAASRLFEVESSGCQTGVDGAQWIVEGADPIKGYRFRDVQSPQAGLERDLGLFLLGLTGWDVEPIY